MSWLIDHANAVYILLAVVAASLVVAWRFNQRVKFLGLAAGVLLLLALVWLLTLFVPTDRKQLEANVNAMAQAVMDGKVDDLFKYISKDFTFKGMTRDALYEAARRSIRAHQVGNVNISNFQVDDVSRAQKSARTSFLVTVRADGDESQGMFRTEADFVLEGDSWKLKTMRFFNPLVDQDREIDLPGIR